MTQLLGSALIAMVLGTQPGPSVCVAIDGSRDTFSPEERRAAVILVTREFRLAGKTVVADADCIERYSLSHAQIGNLITVTLEGPVRQVEGRALGMDDLPALYSQLVRAMIAGSSVGALNVVDRTNVTELQASPKRMQIDSFGYARLGYGAVLAPGGSSNPVIGFGYRAELDSFGLDVSFLNQQVPSRSGYGSSPGVAASLVRLEGLYFTNPTGNASAYLGGGMSWGTTSLASNSSPTSYSSWSGSGLQGELTAGYELPRASAMRVFVQGDLVLPLYRVAQETITYSRTMTSTVTTGHRYTPSIALSVGIGWQRRRD